MEKQLFAYIRVSTSKQGERGVSLQEQHDAIERYAARFGLAINEWFEERESAAKRGRTVFTGMLKLIRQGKACGVIIHKIDRGARNLKDWADLGDMIDAGVEVHFANESLDLNTRGGRLSADIQAVVAADYIRNLREETKKGFYGRLKQGLLPLPAPIGYRDCGKGNVKEPDPTAAPLVVKAFELYGSGNYSLHRLLEELQGMGLRSRFGGMLSLNGLSTLLNNPFYIGLIRVKTTSELYAGIHRPLVSKALFERVQNILQGKTVPRTVRHEFTFRKMLRCAACKYALIGEHQKGHAYYRCHTRECPTVSVREEVIDQALMALFNRLQLSDAELDYSREWLTQVRSTLSEKREEEIKQLTLRLDGVRARLHRLTDAMIDGVLERPLFDDRKNALLLEERSMKDRKLAWERNEGSGLSKVEKFLELAKSASELYKWPDPGEKRDLVRELTSNLIAGDKNIVLEPKLFVQIVAERSTSIDGSPIRGVHRTWSETLARLLKLFDGESVQVN